MDEVAKFERMALDQLTQKHTQILEHLKQHREKAPDLVGSLALLNAYIRSRISEANVQPD